MGWQRAREIVEGSDSRLGRLFDLTVQGLIVAALVTFTIETLPELEPSHRELLNAVEVVLVVSFTVEYLLRLAVAERKRVFVFSFFGIVDLFAILPFYLTTGLDLRSIRAVRLLRLFRIFKLLRYSAAIHRFRRAFTIAKEELVLFGAASLIVLYLAAVGIYYCEHAAQPEAFASVFDGMWWAVATLTTVGYGDVYPVTAGGRIFTFVVLLIGLGVVAVPSGLVASALAQARADDVDSASADAAPTSTSSS